MARTCKRCGKSCQQGVHFDVHEIIAGMVKRQPVMSYDICQECFQTKRPMILPATPAGWRRPIQYDVRFASFDDREQKSGKEAKKA